MFGPCSARLLMPLARTSCGSALAGSTAPPPSEEWIPWPTPIAGIVAVPATRMISIVFPLKTRTVPPTCPPTRASVSGPSTIWAGPASA